MTMTKWLIWASDQDTKPLTAEGDTVRLLPNNDALALGGFDGTGLFVFTAIFAPGTWTRVIQIPSEKMMKEALLGQ